MQLENLALKNEAGKILISQDFTLVGLDELFLKDFQDHALGRDVHTFLDTMKLVFKYGIHIVKVPS